MARKPPKIGAPSPPPLRPAKLAIRSILSLLVSLLTVWTGTGAENPAAAKSPDPPLPSFDPAARVYDVNAHGIPRFVNVDYIELPKIAAITKFRSAEGHDYSDDFESCRSMKHYFKPKDRVDWSTVKISSPVAGVVFRTQDEWAGTKIEIRAKDCPAFTFAIFHVKLLQPLKPGEPVAAGQVLGTHIGPQTYSDIAVSVQTSKGRKLVSYFAVMSDALLKAYQARGLTSQEAVIITKEARDADPLTCQEGKFTTRGTIENWVVLP